MNARMWLAGLLMAVLPSIVFAQGRIAVVNLEQAILQTDVAQQRLEEFESNEDFASDKSQFDALRAELVGLCVQEIGPIAKPDQIQWAPGLPKTRSGKIMRRILRKIAENDLNSLGDTSTLADPSVVEDLIAGRNAL